MARSLGEQCPWESSGTHHGTWRSRGCPSWQGWHRHPAGTPGAGSAFPLTVGQKEGLGGLLKVWWCHPGLLSHLSPKHWGLAQGHLLLPLVPPKAWHTHHTPAENTLHFSEGGHGGVPALVVEVPAAPKAACSRPVRLHGVSQLRDALLRSCRKGHVCGRGTLWHCQWWHGQVPGAMPGVPGEPRTGRGCRYLGTACSSRRGWHAQGWHK